MAEMLVKQMKIGEIMLLNVNRMLAWRFLFSFQGYLRALQGLLFQMGFNCQCRLSIRKFAPVVIMSYNE